MTVSTTSNRITYNGDGTTTVFSFPYKFLATSDLQVYVDDVLQVITTDYSVGAPGDGGANVTLLSAPAAGISNIVILRNPDLLQQSALPSNGPFPAPTIEKMVDKATLVIQRLNELFTRSFRLADSDTSGADTTLPTPASNNVIGWNEGADALQNYTPQTFATIVAFGTANADVFDGDGVTTDFTLTGNPGALNNLDVSIGGVTQTPGDDYSWSSGTTISFASPPPSGVNNIFVRYMQGLPIADAQASAWTQSGTGAIQRTIGEKLRDYVSVLDFGAIGDGVADDTDAFNAALLAHKRVHVPAATYKISGTINITRSGQEILGDGRLSTILVASTANLPVFSVSIGINNVDIGNMYLTRDPVATGGGNGIDCLSTVNLCKFHDLYIEKMFYGMSLGPTGFSSIHDTIVSDCQSDGFLIQNAAIGGGGQLQWSLLNVLSQKNAGRGFRVSSLVAAGVPCTMGTWLNVATFANSGVGVAILGSATSPISGFRLRDSFIGGDGNSAIYLDSYGYLHTITDCLLEASGTGSTGPGVLTPASNVGNGIQILANNFDVIVSGCTIHNNSYAGISSSCTSLTFTSNSVSNNGVSGTQRYGVLLIAGAGNLTGNKIGNISGSGQTHAVFINADLSFNIIGNDFRGNVTGAVITAGVLTKPIYTHNLPQTDAWVSVTGATGAILKGSGIASVVRNSAGKYTITLSTAMPDTSYEVMVTPRSANDSNSWAGFETLASAHSTTVFSVGVTQATAAGTMTFADPTSFYVAVKGL